MVEIALARINSFASPAPTADFIQALLAELSALREEVTRLEETNQCLQDRIEILEKDRDNTTSNIEILFGLNKSRQEEISGLSDKKHNAGKTEQNRVLKVIQYLQERPDHKAEYTTLMGLLKVDGPRVSETIRTLMRTHPGEYCIKAHPGDKRKRIIVMLPK